MTMGQRSTIIFLTNLSFRSRGNIKGGQDGSTEEKRTSNFRNYQQY